MRWRRQIDQVGPGGEFISRKETARHLRREVWIPRLMDRQPWLHWAAHGIPSMQDRIRDRLRAILATHMPPPLPEGAAETIVAILGRGGEADQGIYL